ncbi:MULTISPECIES: hypothetical protein [Okeania]|nr:MULTISPECIES: hypothetical protein [Okeania]NET13787.1 hypothetical protein [Okeania sp. SIO1H6]NEP73965.1 hypothetical protein [Okeania sp. SIO2G5]NEP94780.1 hypothetical protein [Okeania sp. SIO2F5]NEQ92476.1 hypothetical protein [Okeania sp. SIO2G4]NES76367.1 hypothetical protein [Okeania sp. SIO1H4]
MDQEREQFKVVVHSNGRESVGSVGRWGVWEEIKKYGVGDLRYDIMSR